MKILPRTLISFFLHFAKRQKWSFILFSVAPIFLVFETTIMPYALKIIIDSLQNFKGNRSDIFQHLASPLKLFAGGWLAWIFVARFQNWLQAYAIPRFQAEIRLESLEYTLGHSYRFFSENFAGNLGNKISELSRALEDIRLMLSWAIMPPFIGALVALFFMWKMHPFFALLLLGWISINISISLAFARHIQKVSEVISEDRSKLSGCIVDVLSNVISVKAFARKMQDLDYVIKYQNIEKQNYKRIIILLNWLRGSMDIQLFAVMTLMVTGSIIGWQRGFVSAGDVAFLVFATNSLMNQVWVMSESFSNLFREIGTAKQSLAVLSESHELLDSASAKDLVVAEGKIEFENVHFSYNKNNSLFSDKNLIIEPGQKVGLVGFSGSGKTTFVNLILRFFDIKAGEIKIDGQNIAKVTQESLRKNIAMIPQEASLFHRSLMENIRYGNLNATDNQVIEAAKKANCHEFIMQLNDDYQTLVGERGIKLSGGQRQRIAIARAILKNAPILILDEATSALDSITEKYIQDSLNQLMQNRTTIVVAHRLSTLAKMDRIIVFDNGKIIEDGNHQMLLNNNSHYAKLWNMQAGGFLPEKEE